MVTEILEFASRNWRSAIEIAILTVVIYYSYLYFRGTRGAKVLTGLALIFLTFTLLSQLLQLEVLNALIRSLTAFLAFALVVIFQPEVRRALAALGSHHVFSSASQSREAIEILAETAFELSNRQFGALIALERDTDIGMFADSGVSINCDLSPELIITIFQPKTPLHDGGLIIREDRIISAGCVFPVSQREDLDRNLGLRHRAALGLTEESDAITIVVSEETGIISICHHGVVERRFDPETFKKRLGQLLLLEKNEKTDTDQLDSESRLASPGDDTLVSH